MPRPTAIIFLVGTEDEFEVENAINAQLPAGAITSYQYGGGAGFEDPLLRDPAGGARRMYSTNTSASQAARDRYGVVLTRLAGELGSRDRSWTKPRNCASERLAAKTAGSAR